MFIAHDLKITNGMLISEIAATLTLFKRYINPNEAGIFEGGFFWGGGGDGGQSDPHTSHLPLPPLYLKKNLSNISITLCNC